MRCIRLIKSVFEHEIEYLLIFCIKPISSYPQRPESNNHFPEFGSPSVAPPESCNLHRKTLAHHTRPPRFAVQFARRSRSTLYYAKRIHIQSHPFHRTSSQIYVCRAICVHIRHNKTYIQEQRDACAV